jgi:hypothetical protein
MPNISSQRKQPIVERWLALTLQTYPSQSVRFLLHEKDPFRNPVGHTLKEGIPLLVDELLGDMNANRIAQALEGIVRIRAVQSLSASQAVGFVFLLKKVLREEWPADLEVRFELENRVDEMALAAFDLFMRCREQVYEVQVGEARRKVSLLEKIYSGVEGR